METWRSSWWRSHCPAGDWLGIWALSNDKALGFGIIDCTAVVEVLGAIILVVVALNWWFRGTVLRWMVWTMLIRIKVLFVERTNSICSLFRSLVWVIRRQRAHQHRKSLVLVFRMDIKMSVCIIFWMMFISVVVCNINRVIAIMIVIIMILFWVLWMVSKVYRLVGVLIRLRKVLEMLKWLG
jgi:hypothetical protein